MKQIAILLLSASLCLFAIVHGAETGAASKEQPNIGLGFNLGFQKPYCDVVHTGVGLAGEFMARFYLSKYFDLSFGLGYGTLNDGFTYNTFQTTLINGDLKANIHLSKPGKYNPYISIGAGVVSFNYTKNKPWAIGSEEMEGESFFDGSFIYGGGMEVMLSPQTALNLLADYRFSTGDALDGAELGKSKDGYLNTRIGLTYYLGKRPLRDEPSDEELLAMHGTEYGVISGSEKSGSNEKLAMFEAKLDKLEASDTELSLEQYVRLKSRVDELAGLIDGKDQELDELKSTLTYKNQRIADLESSVQRTGSGSVAFTGFSTNYEEALRLFFSRNYRSAIDTFSDLLNRHPNHDMASNCQYWIGESLFGLREYRTAADAFQKVFGYNKTTKRDDATIMLGRCYYNLNEWEKARSYFQTLIDEYPSSEYTGKAKQWLSRL